MNYSKTIVDSTGKQYDRKNMYLLDLANSSKDTANSILKNKNQHQYNIELKSYRDKEKVFLNDLKKMEKEYADNYKASKDMFDLEKQVFIAQKSIDFYKEYIKLTYDAQFDYLVNIQKLKHIPQIIQNQNTLKDNLEIKLKALKNIDENSRNNILQDIKKYEEDIKKDLEIDLKSLKEKFDGQLISKKAYKNEIKMLNEKYKRDKLAYSYNDPKKSLEEEIKNIRHHLKIDKQIALNVMKHDISDVFRNTPIEVEKQKPKYCYMTFLLPGLGQLLNGQKIKSILFALLSLFIYIIAIPYFLGYGNYRGQGFYGLINLAKDASKLDKSIIFMIEGIVALALISLAIFILFISFSDVKKVEKLQIQGIRAKNWFETMQSIKNEGFPYLVSIPSYIVVLFIIIVPIMTTVLISFTNLDPNHQNKFSWIGLQNYMLILKGDGIAGGAFYLIFLWTIIWTIGASTLAIAVGFMLSLIVNQDRVRGKAFFRTIYLLPWAVPAFITIMFFSLMLARGGPLTQLINNVFNVSLDIKNDTNLTRITLILLQTWLGSSYIFLLTTGVMQGIPNDLYEAAEIDGARGFQKTLRITIPLVLFQISPLLIGQYAFNFNNFSIIYLFNGGGPFNPSLYGNLAGSTDLLISYIFKLTIKNQYQAIGASITMVISFGLMLFSYIGFRKTKAFKED